MEAWATFQPALYERARLLVGVVGVYAVVNFALFLRATGGVTIEQKADGHYALNEHGKFIRSLSEDDLRAFHAWEIRAFSGHILPFLVLPGLYFVFAPRTSRPQQESYDE